MFRRTPSFAGSFYPGDEVSLKKTINRYLSDVKGQNIKDEVVAIISPHAGYVYSGPVAAYGYDLLRDKDISVVILIAPSHRAHFKGYSVIPEGVYQTPMGDVEIDSTIGLKLSNSGHASFLRDVDQAEHSLEVQVPFLQSILADFTLVPIIVGTTDLKICAEIAGEIHNALKDDNRKMALVISTDLSHYHQYDEAVRIDRTFITALETFEEAAVDSILNSEDAEACGHGPILTGMILSKKMGAKSVKILCYKNSGDTAGDKKQVVGYLSAAFTR